jgi:2-polyprenyl-3-methyl-5-hydroxy-6-metoxy-1,4-benzoquinol methylase
MTFANPSPSEFGDGTFYDEKGSRFYLSDEKLKGDYSPVRYQREIQLFRRFCPKGKVLDVGCSTGGFLFQLNQASPGDYQCWGTDVASDALAFAETKGVRVLRENFLQPTTPSLQFDAITFWAVLEHVLEPSTFLQAARNSLATGGVCYILVPNFKSLATRLLGARYRYILPQHLNYFTGETLRGLAAKNGFEVVHCTTTHFNPIVIWKDFRARETEATDADRASLLARTNAMKVKKSLALLRVGYNFSEKFLRVFSLADNLAMVLKKTAS